MTCGQNDRAFQRIIYEDCEPELEIQNLDREQKQDLQMTLSQKFVNETVFKRSYPQEFNEEPDHAYHPPTILNTLCCCLYPDQNRYLFDVSSQFFFKKVKHVFMFWKGGFLDLREDMAAQEYPGLEGDLPGLIMEGVLVDDEPDPDPDLYGPLWITVTYVLILSLVANINAYFTLNQKEDFDFEMEEMVKAVGVRLIFGTVELIVYTVLVNCLSGYIPVMGSVCLLGYSLLLYCAPTLLCFISSDILHMILLMIAAVLRFLFLSANLGGRVEGKQIIVYIFVLCLEFVQFGVTLATFFNADSGPLSSFSNQLNLRNYTQ